MAAAVGGFIGEDVRPIVFVQAFKARRKIHRIAERSIAVPQGGAHIADTGDTGIQADADIEFGFAFRFPLLLQFVDALHHVERGVASLDSVARVLVWGAPEGHDRVADVFVQSALSIEDDLASYQKDSHSGRARVPARRVFRRWW